MIDHHKSAYDIILSESSKGNLKCVFYTLKEYYEVFVSSIKNCEYIDSSIKYCYSYDEPISAAKMVYLLCQNSLGQLGIKDKLMFDDLHQYSNIIDIVSDYDIARYEIEDSKPFINGFYNMNLNLDLSFASPLIFQKILELDIKQVIKKGKDLDSINQKIAELALESIWIVELNKAKISTLITETKEIEEYCEENKVDFDSLNLVLFAVDCRKIEQYRTLVGNLLNK